MTREPQSLPDDDGERIQELRKRATSDRLRPRASTEVECVLEPLEEQSARCYVEIEDATFRLHRIAARIRGDRPGNGITKGKI